MDKLFIIGNGFDIAHGLPTQYDKFRQYLASNANFELSDSNFVSIYDFHLPSLVMDSDGNEVFLEEDLKSFFYLLVTQLTEGDWNNFESSLSRLVNTKIDVEPIVDKDGDIDGFKTEAYYQELNDSLIASLPELQASLFPEWMKSIPKSEGYHKAKPNCKTVLDNHDTFFLTFNYTHLLEEKYHISSENICHIHGSIADNEFIYGHDGNVLEIEETEFYMDITPALKEANNVFQKPVSKQLTRYKELFQKLSTIKEIYIFGFNLTDKNSVDAPYFKELFSQCPNSSIFINSYDVDLKKSKSIAEILSAWGSKKASQLTVLDMEKNKIEFQLKGDCK